MMEKKIRIGSDFSGVGAFNQALIRLGISYKEVYACDMDKYARQTFALNYGEPNYFPKDVYEREIPKESLDIYMTSPPCQAFSLAGKRKGEEDKRGVLFYNSHEFIQKNNPRYFIFENVKGLLSDDNGKTFQRWIDFLGGKSVNGNPVIFPHEESVPYHVYYQVLNAKHYGIPQNRERIFIIGIRDDEDNNFSFPKPMHLTKRLKDVLESEVAEKYFLSDKMLELLEYNGKKNGVIADLNKGGQKGEVHSDDADFVSCLTATDYKQPKQIQIGTWRTHEDGKGFRATEDNNCPTIPARAREDGSGQPVIKMLGYTRDEKGKVVLRHEKDVAGTIHTSSGSGGNTDQFVIGAIRGRNPENPKSRKAGLPFEQMIEINENGTSNALTTVQKDNIVIISANTSKGYEKAEEEEDSINFSVLNSQTRRGRVGKKVSQTLDTQCNQGIYTQQRIRRLTPLECFRLMDFNENFVWNVSDSQAYKQAGNSICVGVLAEIIKKFNL